MRRCRKADFAGDEIDLLTVAAVPRCRTTGGVLGGDFTPALGARRSLRAQTLPFYLAGEACTPNTDLEVHDKFTGKVAYRVAQATADDIDKCAPGARARAAAQRGAPTAGSTVRLWCVYDCGCVVSMPLLMQYSFAVPLRMRGHVCSEQRAYAPACACLRARPCGRTCVHALL